MTADHSRARGDALRVVVLDVANVMGSRPDGWWRDRAGAAARILGEAAAVCAEPGAGAASVVAVLEGAARAAPDPCGGGGVEVVRAPGPGDDTIADVARRCVRALAEAAPRLDGGARVVVVTADRGLRERLPDEAVAVGPRWWWDLVATRAGRST